MSYPLSSPVDISDSSPVELTLSNTSGSVVWKERTDLTENLIFGTTNVASTDILTIKPDSITDPFGKIVVPKAGLTNGTELVNLMADIAATTTYDFVYPPVAPTDGQIIVASGVASNTFADLNPKNTLTVRKNPAPTEFSSIVAAIASIPVSPAPNYPDFDNAWVIKIYAGVYTETAINVPAYVYLVGDSMQSVSVYQDGTGFSLFTFNAPSGLAFMGVGNTDPDFPALNCNNCGDFLIFHKITVVENVDKFLSCITDNTATDNSIIYLEYVDTTACTDYTILAQDTNLLGGFGTTISAENFFTFEHSNDSIIIDGLNSTLLVHAVELQSDGSGNAIHIKNGAHCDIRSTAIMNYTNGLLVDDDGSTPHVIATGMTFQDCTLNINILNSLTTGNFTGYSEYLKTIVPKAAPFFITGKNQQVITVGAKGADFTSVVAALASITDNSIVNRYIVYVTPGVYVETQIILKPYVSLAGSFQTACILLAHPSVVGTPFIIGAGYAAIDRLTISTFSYAAPPSYLVQFTGDPGGVHFRCDNIILDNSADLMYIGTSSGPCIFLLLNSLLNMSAPFVNGILMDDAGPNNFPMIFTIDNLIWGADATGVSALNEIITIRSYKTPSPGAQNIFGAITGCSMGTNFYGPAGIGFTIEGAVYIVVDTCVFGGMTTALQVLPSAEATFLILSSCTISNNTIDIDIQSTNAFGTINSNATLSKVFINDATNFGVQINDESGTLAFGGDLFQGIKWSEITNISEQIQHASTTGIIDGQATIIDIGGLNVSISGGTGYVFFGPLSSNRLKYIQWSSNPSFALTDNDLNWLFVDSDGLISKSSSQPDPIANIILGTVKTFSGGITYIQQIGNVINNLASNIDATLRNTYGPIVQSGCLGSPGSNVGERAVQISSGSYSLSTTDYPPTGGDNISMIGYYGGTSQTAPFTNIPLQYDNAGVLTNIPGGSWAKHAVYIISSLAGVTQYFMVYAQELFASELDAQTGPIPSEPPFFTGNMCPTVAIIVTNTDPSSSLSPDRFRDIRPIVGYRATGSTASADHNSLLNLTVGNAHPQYFRVDGTSTMTGNINLGANNIVGLGGNLLNGVNLSAHAARHVPGGADPLPTGIAVSVGAANSAGAAASFARSDHIHAGVTSITGTLNQITSSAFQGALTLATPNTFLAPGTIQDTSGMYYSTTSGISASGATQGAAAPLTTSYNVVTTTPSNTGVRLPTPNTEGLRIVIVNRGVNTLRVYPDVGGSIDSVAINGYVEIPSGTTATYEAATTIQWFTVKDVIVSGAGTTVVYDNGRTIVNASGVSTFSAGTTGLTPVAPTNGAVVLSGILNAVNGGTGQSAYTVGDLLYASGASTLSKLVSPTTGNALISGGVGVAPLWGKINLTSTVSGVLPVSNGGTGQSTYSVGDLLYASGASTLSKLVSPVTGNLLKSGGLTTAPFWGKVDLSNDITGILSNAQGGTGLNTSTAANGTLLIGNGSGLTLSTLTTGTGINVANGSGTIGISNTGVLSFSAGTTGLLPVAPTTGAIILAGILNVLNGGTGLSTYTIGDTLYASGATTISKLPAVATGNALISGGISTAPLWGKINLGNTVSGILPAANGGTGQSTYTIGDLLFANTISTLSKLPAVATGNALISTGIGVAPNWGKINLSTTASGTLQAAQAPAFTGNVTSAAGSLTLTIANAVVTNAKLANMPSNRIKGNNTGGVTSPIDLTTAQTTAMLDLFTSTLKGLVPSSGGGTSNFLRADGTWTAPPGAGGSPGGANTNVQYNNGGTFGGSNAFNFVGGANPVVNIQGTASTTQLTVGGTANTGNATSYIEVASKGSSIEGLRCYFNRGTPGINGWITYDYDGSTPNIRITDEDDDPPYIQFNVIGGGTYQAPKFSNVFGGRGPTSGATTGFSWKVGGAEISTMDSNFFLPPTGTSGFRPAPATNGMMRYNTTTNKMESYVPAVWQSLTGIIDKSTTTQTTNAGGSSNMVSYVVPGGTLSNNNILRVRVSGLWVVGSTNRNVTIGISYGGATLWQSTSNSPSNGSNPSWFVYFDLLADNNTNAQILNGQVFIGRGVNATAGFGSLSSNEVLANTPIFGSSSINSNLNQTLIVNVSIETGSNTWFKNMHTIELL